MIHEFRLTNNIPVELTGYGITIILNRIIGYSDLYSTIVDGLPQYGFDLILYNGNRLYIRVGYTDDTEESYKRVRVEYHEIKKYLSDVFCNIGKLEGL